MPNWCMNRLEITAESKAELDEVMEAIRSDEEPLSFEKICPTPPELEGATSPSGGSASLEDSLTRLNNVMSGNEKNYKDWYEHHLGEWGTKWELNGVNLVDDWDENEAMLEFDSAWSPPTKIVDKLMDRFPKIHFTLYYFEPGCCFAGEYGSEGDICYSDDEEYEKYATKHWGDEWFEPME